MYALIVFSSVSHANMVRKSLDKHLKYIMVVSTPQKLGANSCSYSVRVKFEDISEVQKLANHLTLKIKGIFVEEVLEDKTRRYSSYDIS